jgi:Bacterial HORMA domain 2
MTTVAVNTYTQSVTYVADNILKSIKDIIRLSGLDPSNFVGSWDLNLRGITTWMSSGHLERIVLEIYNPKTDGLVRRWDVEIAYGWTSGDGGFWTDTDQIKHAILKAGMVPSDARYRLLVDRKPGWDAVDGWVSAQYRSTNGMVRQSLGATVEHSGLGANAAYWRKAS